MIYTASTATCGMSAKKPASQSKNVKISATERVDMEYMKSLTAIVVCAAATRETVDTSGMIAAIIGKRPKQICTETIRGCGVMIVTEMSGTLPMRPASRNALVRTKVILMATSSFPQSRGTSLAKALAAATPKAEIFTGPGVIAMVISTVSLKIRRCESTALTPQIETTEFSLDLTLMRYVLMLYVMLLLSQPL